VGQHPNLKAHSGRTGNLRILKSDLQIFANHWLSFGADFKVLGQNGWTT